MNIEETISAMVASKVSIGRFGDGELGIISDESDIGFQEFDSLLKIRLSEVLACDENERFMVCIPNLKDDFRIFKEDSVKFWMDIKKNHSGMFQNVPLNKTYGDAFITRFYLAFEDKKYAASLFDTLSRVWNDRDIVFVEGEYTRLGVGNSLFDNCRSIRRIICPSKNAFACYDRIFDACKTNARESDLFIISLGPTATVLAYDLSLCGYQALDLGHIDIQYEYMLRGVNEVVEIEGKYNNEFKTKEKMPIGDELLNEKYFNEIICKIM